MSDWEAFLLICTIVLMLSALSLACSIALLAS